MFNGFADPLEDPSGLLIEDVYALRVITVHSEAVVDFVSQDSGGAHKVVGGTKRNLAIALAVSERDVFFLYMYICMLEARVVSAASRDVTEAFKNARPARWNRCGSKQVVKTTSLAISWKAWPHHILRTFATMFSGLTFGGD